MPSEDAKWINAIFNDERMKKTIEIFLTEIYAACRAQRGLATRKTTDFYKMKNINKI